MRHAMRHGLTLYLIVACFASLYFGRNSVEEIRGPRGAIDLHAYWLAGHFLRDHTNPYAATLAGADAPPPAYYLDQQPDPAAPVAQPNLSYLPAITAPLVLLLSSFAWLSWLPAKLLWSAINLLLMLAVPWLVLRLLPERLPWRWEWALALTYYCLSGTRVAWWVGQPTLLVFILMLCALLVYKRHEQATGQGNQIVAALCLGLAISKYSVALPLLLVFLVRRQYLIVAGALLVQATGLGLLALWTNSSPRTILQNYVGMFYLHSSQGGIHWGTLFAEQGVIYYLTLLAGSLWVFYAGFCVWQHPFSIDATPDATRDATPVAGVRRIQDLHLLALFCLWALLVAYHRVYDTTLVVLWMVLIVYGLHHPTLWRLTRAQILLLQVGLLLFVAIMAVPTSQLDRWLDAVRVAQINQAVSYSRTLALVVALGVTLWLPIRLPKDQRHDYQSGVVPQPT